MTEDLTVQTESEPILEPPITLPEPVTEPECILPRQHGRDLPRQYADLSALYVAGARLCAILEWDPLIRETLRVVTALVHADGVSLMLVDERQGALRLAGATHLTPRVIAETVQPLGTGVAGWVA